MATCVYITFLYIYKENIHLLVYKLSFLVSLEVKTGPDFAKSQLP